VTTSQLEGLSVQQKKLLGDGLRAHYRTPMDIGNGVADPGCFGVKEGRKIDIETGHILPISDPKAREVRRTSKARAVQRLITRGLLESCSRGKWRLTRAGVKVAKVLWPGLKPPTKRELQSQIAFREAVHSVVMPRRRKPRTKIPQTPAKVAAAGGDGIEIEMDF
jgi:hypothetical protein